MITTMSVPVLMIFAPCRGRTPHAVRVCPGEAGSAYWRIERAGSIHPATTRGLAPARYRRDEQVPGHTLTVALPVFYGDGAALRTIAVNQNGVPGDGLSGRHGLESHAAGIQPQLAATGDRVPANHQAPLFRSPPAVAAMQIRTAESISDVGVVVGVTARKFHVPADELGVQNREAGAPRSGARRNPRWGACA